MNWIIVDFILFVIVVVWIFFFFVFVNIRFVDIVIYIIIVVGRIILFIIYFESFSGICLKNSFFYVWNKMILLSLGI